MKKKKKKKKKKRVNTFQLKDDSSDKGLRKGQYRLKQLLRSNQKILGPLSCQFLQNLLGQSSPLHLRL